MTTNGHNFSHPNFGREVRIEVWGHEVRLTFVANTEQQAADLGRRLLRQAENGELQIRLKGKPERVRRLE